MKSGQPRFGVVSADGTIVEARRYAQSTSGHVSSHVTLPPDSRSIAMDNHSAHDLPYTTLRRCPTDVLQRDAKASRSVGDSESQYSLSCMPDYHHKVTVLSTPTGEFTKRCKSPENVGMGNNLAAMHEIRRRNFERLCEIRFQANRSKLARKLGVQASYVNDRIKPGGRTLGEEAARKIEQKVGLFAGQLDLQDSPLRMDERAIDKVDEEIRDMVDGLSEDEKRDTFEFLSVLIGRRKKRRRT